MESNQLRITRSIAMNSSESLDSNALRQRIAALEEDLRNAQVVKEDAELHAHKMAQHAHHVRHSFFSPVHRPSNIARAS